MKYLSATKTSTCTYNSSRHEQGYHVCGWRGRSVCVPTFIPFIPFIPSVPGVPSVPFLPGKPMSPLLPVGPVSPGRPFSPIIPLSPGIPGIPGGPGGPGSPSIPPVERERGRERGENMDHTDTNTSFSATYVSLGSLMAPVVLVEIVPQALPSVLVFHLPLEHQRLLVARPYRCCQVDRCLPCFRLCHHGQGVPWVPASLLYPSSQAFQESPVRKG